MARVLLAQTALDDRHELVASHALPPDAPRRVARALALLERHPDAGLALGARWAGYRAWRGPWPWMLHVYEHDAATETVVVVTVQDSRRSTAPDPAG